MATDNFYLSECPRKKWMEGFKDIFEMVQWAKSERKEENFHDGYTSERKECSCVTLCRHGDFNGISHPELISHENAEGEKYACHIRVKDNDTLAKTLESYFNSEKIFIKKEKS